LYRYNLVGLSDKWDSRGRGGGLYKLNPVDP
jgi:hypothetical protein